MVAVCVLLSGLFSVSLVCRLMDFGIGLGVWACCYAYVLQMVLGNVLGWHICDANHLCDWYMKGVAITSSLL
jgi:hypothetical protein